ncbi:MULTISPECIES: bifunctional methylenetetrahydrofolate dehydrogenase/methenyltetrahydrofolate cyclohydrolase FolD [Cobetia]|uniref:bifunctional methylenetetrahydrofolate dehydrogenase/methenyltetrahydrofolate cyclohydrolase FolD n=1 Tax=Cobetia TaxID=204286 RepID=UPI000985ABDE|nr:MULTISPECIES: bifunctional methylenetetrahydrofolate dehydrogenase/methenyltetrahydrofolate cyclohydrolase FolD [Cobetia]POR08917.1 bifunctional methylenetetrahydrofolate dehydrogenase/methenyltetrahydrofolate cyclohydrolase [Cobetia sp. MM1IDA2H-1]
MATNLTEKPRHSAQLIDGRRSAARLQERVATDVVTLKKSSGITPGLAVVLVGEDPASEIYVNHKIRRTTDVGMISLCHRLPVDTTEKMLLELIAGLNTDIDVHGILVQLPLPAHLDQGRIIETIAPEKDVDGFTALNIGRLVNRQPGLVPCTPLGCMTLLKETVTELRGKVVAVVGCSNVVGRPLIQLLLKEDCSVLVLHRYSRDTAKMVRTADIVVVAAGSPGLVRGDWLKPGAVVIDVGINRIETDDGTTRIVGDVAFEEALEAASAITPVPGGVGPMTIACLLANTLTACQRQIGA